jgi:two-component system, LytTR family, response regulator
MLHAIIIDDEENSSNALKAKLQRHFPEVEVVAVCNGGEKGIECIEQLHPEVVFLDIEMPRMNGFTMLQQLQFRDFDIIFTTAHDHYAITAIRYSALDYLVKPVEVEELRAAIERIKGKQDEPNKRLELLLENIGTKPNPPERIAVPTNNGLEFLKLTRIIYLEASINYTHIFLDDGRKFIVSRTLKDFEDLLPSDRFIRIHNAHIINMSFAEKYIRGEGGQVVLSNGIVLDISKRKKAEFLKAISL